MLRQLEWDARTPPQKDKMTEKKLSPNAKMAADFIPLIIFGVTYAVSDIFTATIAIVIATLISLAITYSVEKHIAKAPAVTAIILVFFGALTIVFDDPVFFYVKPTIVSLFFAVVLLFGLLTNKPIMKILFEQALELEDEGWSKLTFRWMLLFFFLAGVNEFVWRNFDESTWVNYKLFGATALTLIFTFAQAPLIMKYQIVDEDADQTNADPS